MATIKNIFMDTSYSRSTFQFVINNVPQHIFWKDTKLRYMGCNKSFLNTLGLKTLKDLVGKTDFELLADKEQAQRCQDTDNEVMTNNKPIYHMIESYIQNGKKMWLNVNKVPLRDKNDKVIGVLGTVEDITERIDLETKAKQNENKYKNLIEFTQTAYWILDEKLNIIETNQIFADLIEATSIESVLNKNPRTWIFSDDIESFDRAFQSVLKGKLIKDLQINLISEQNKNITITLNANSLVNGCTRVLCLMQDVTHRKNYDQKKYIDGQKNKDRIKKNISEIREKLKIIQCNG